MPMPMPTTMPSRPTLSRLPLQSIHEEYLEFFEEKLEDFVRRQGGDLAELMADW